MCTKTSQEGKNLNEENSIFFAEKIRRGCRFRIDEKMDILKYIHIDIIHNHIIQIWLTTNTLVNDVIQVMIVFPFMITAFLLHTSLQFAIW